MTISDEYRNKRADYEASEAELDYFVFIRKHPICRACFWFDVEGLPSEFCDNPGDCLHKEEK